MLSGIRDRKRIRSHLKRRKEKKQRRASERQRRNEAGREKTLTRRAPSSSHSNRNRPSSGCTCRSGCSKESREQDQDRLVEVKKTHRGNSLEGDGSFVEGPKPEARVRPHLLQKLIVLEKVSPLSGSKTRDDVLPSKVDSVVEISLKEAKFVIENHGAVSSSSVGELFGSRLGDWESSFLVEDTGEILEGRRGREKSSASERNERGRETDSQRFELSSDVDRQRDGS